MLLDYHPSLFEPQPAKPTAVWMPPPPIKKPRRRRVSLSLDGVTTSVEMYTEARVRNHAAIDRSLLTITFSSR